MKTRLCTLLMLFATAGAALILRAETVLVPKAVSVAQGEEFTVKLLWTNTGGESLLLHPPRTLAGRLHAGTARSEDVQLVASAAPAELNVAPGAFAQVDYSFRLPPEIAGPVVLEVIALGAQPVMFSVQEAELSTAAQKPSNIAQREAATKAAHETALRRSTRLLPGITAYEPIYFGLGGHGGLNAKFQISFKYNPFDLWPFYLGYTQTSLWDLHSDSKPFRDTVYRPALFYLNDHAWSSADGRLRFGWQAGFEHESNGRDGLASRSISTQFVRPRLEWRFSDDVHLTLSTKFYEYLEKADNPDIADYRGHADLQIGLLSYYGRVTTTLRKGTVGSKGSIQVDTVLPLHVTDDILARVGVHGVNGYFFLQYFNGWGETIIDYNSKLLWQWRTGLMLVP
jgi:outer membrane phospholipase A